jgi:nucleoside-diphosphate-sugar epimerase
MKVWITGIAGVLGSNLARRLKAKGFDVTGNDVVKPNDAWRLKGSDIKWQWKATEDLTLEDISNVDIVMDAGLAVPDRPLGTNSPKYTLINNLMPPMGLLELVKQVRKKPWLIYPSSFNALYGWIFKGIDKFSENLSTFPTSIYGWSKGSAESLYLTYHFTYRLPVSVIRTGSTFGEGGRLDELPHKLIAYGLLNKPEFFLRSPHAKRLWGYVGDVLEFYDKLFERGSPEDNYEILHLAGNRSDEIVDNVDLAKRIFKLTNADTNIKEGEYELGEEYKGKPIAFTHDAEFTRNALNWKPSSTLDDGLGKTIKWFKENRWFYNTLE